MPRFRNDVLLFIDFEEACWGDTPIPEGMWNEIIEIGVAEVEVETLTVKRSTAYFVRPRKSTVSEYCTRLTGIDGDMLRRAPYLVDVLNRVKNEYGLASKAWCAWGRDKDTIDTDCSLYRDKAHPSGLVSPFSGAFYDFGLLFSMMTGSRHAQGLDDARSLLGLPAYVGRHRAGPDAKATAELWCELSREFRSKMAPIAGPLKS